MTRLVLSSAWLPVCPATYLLRAARRMKIDARTVGLTSGDRIDQWEDVKLFPGFGVRPDVVVPDPTDPDASWARIKELAAWSDIWIDVDGGWFLEADIPAKRRVLVATDPHCAKICPRNSYATQRGFVKSRNVFVMQSNHCRPGEKWFPYAYDPEWFFPEDAPYTDDVTNLGAPYPHRVAISDALYAKGLSVVGPGRTEIGPAHRRELCSAPIAVVWPMTDDLPCRVFEALACGAWVATRAGTDYDRIADGSLPVWRFSRPDVLVDHVASVAREVSPDGPDWRRSPRAEEFLARHTWDARLAQLVEGREAP